MQSAYSTAPADRAVVCICLVSVYIYIYIYIRFVLNFTYKETLNESFSGRNIPPLLKLKKTNQNFYLNFYTGKVLTKVKGVRQI